MVKTRDWVDLAPLSNIREGCQGITLISLSQFHWKWAEVDSVCLANSKAFIGNMVWRLSRFSKKDIQLSFQEDFRGLTCTVYQLFPIKLSK